MQFNATRLTLSKAQTRETTTPETTTDHNIRNSVSYSPITLPCKVEDAGDMPYGLYSHIFSTTFNTLIGLLNLTTSVSRQSIPLSPT